MSDTIDSPPDTGGPADPPAHGRVLAAPARGGAGLAVLRIVVGITWLHEAAWKTPPEFSGLADWVSRPLEHPTLGAWNAMVEAVILPNLTQFGWLTLLVEASLGGFLIVGLATRLWAAVGVLQATAIALSVISVPGEWSYAYYLFIAAHIALLAGAAGRSLGIDGLLRSRWLTLADHRSGVGGRAAWALGRAS
ncbi:MAG TPA: TQO small subunit DoxD [Euzebya sp.]|nr:TQO small subunit DoxD [Euzebya sp.]